MSVAFADAVADFDPVALSERLVARALDLVLAGKEQVLEVALPAAAPMAALAWVPDDAVFWAGPDGLTTVGFGVSARLVASGRGRFHELGVAAQELFDRLDVSECSSPVRLHVGCSFADDVDPHGRWAGFAAADAVLPAVSAQQMPDGWILRIAVTRRTVIPVLGGQIRRALRGLVSGPARERPLPREATRSASADYQDLVRDIVARIDSGEAKKIVAARRVQVRLDDPQRDAAAVERLYRAYPDCHRFAFRRPGATFLGASPEPLVRLRGRSVDTVALAGSAAASADGERALQASVKDAAEHAHVVDHLRHALGPFCAEFHVAGQPRIRRLRHILHLETPVSGTLSRPVHILRLVAALHPTPAVGGVPRETALAWIGRHEGADRGWYSGPVGWFDSAGDGEIAVAIRSGLLRGDHASLWAGAGIVHGSNAGLEDAETLQKLRPLLHAIGVEE